MVWVVSQAGGQIPFVTVLSCADSRVVPEMIFDQGIGDIFSLRVTGNVAEDDTVIASMEYSIAELGVPLIVVLGHQCCGAVQAAIAGGDLPGHLNSLMRALEPAIEQAREQGDNVLFDATIMNVQRQVEN
jgi:carbonic anhydrase